MKTVFGYIRVSTQKQGVRGSSLQEQRSAIEVYAQRNGLEIIQWFEEMETAAKRGRPTFIRMMEALSNGRVRGVIIHKIDRSSRNLRDWADLGDLIDKGVDIHFAHESLDLNSRGGRLSADIQAVVAADFIRNLRQEVKKGFYGRLKQGLYPLAAPIGYRDMGRGNVKEIDPIQGPLIRQAFELYGTGDFNFDDLGKELHRRGIRTRRGGRVSKNGLTTILNNPFYIGLIHVRKTDETFQGAHSPIISKALYDHVQLVLRGGRPDAGVVKHQFLFRRLIRCKTCGLSLIGERQKQKYIYYRCHNAACGVVCLSEPRIDAEIRRLLSSVILDDRDFRDVREGIKELRRDATDEKAERTAAIKMAISQVDERLARLTDALIDASIDKDLFESRKSALLRQRRGLLDQLADIGTAPSRADIMMGYLELANTAYLQYENGYSHEKREIVFETTSNFIGEGNTPVITLKSPLRELAEANNSLSGELHRDTGRTNALKILELFGRYADKEVAEIAARQEREKRGEQMPMAA